MEFTKAQKRVLAKVKDLGDTLASPAMVAQDLGLTMETVKKHLKALENKGAVTGKDCNFHDNTTVYGLTEEALFWTAPVAV